MRNTVLIIALLTATGFALRADVVLAQIESAPSDQATTSAVPKVASDQDSAAASQTAPSDQPKPRGKPALKDKSEPRDKPGKKLAVQANGTAPDVYLLPDREGKLRKVIGYPYDDFAKSQKQAAGLGKPNAQPRYTIQSVKISGVEKNERMDLAVTLEIRVNVDQWVGIPLNLAGAVLVRAPQPEKGTDLFLEYHENEQGYVLWLRSKAERLETVSLSMLAPLGQSHSEHTLVLKLPRASETECVIDVDSPSALGTASDGVMLLSTKKSKTNGTRFVTRGSGHPFELRWKEAKESAVANKAVLQVTGEIFVDIDGPSRTSEASLTVQSLGAPFRRLTVQLPEGSELIPSPAENYTVRSITNSKEKDAQSEDRLVEVELAEETQGPVVIRLETQSLAEEVGREQKMNLGGFHVLGSLQETGRLAVRVDGQWSVLWPAQGRTTQSVRQIETPKLPEALRTLEPQFAFEYYRAPFVLPAQVIEQHSHRRVDSETVIRVGARRADLETDIRFFVTGSKIFDLELDPSGWTMDEIGPATHVEEYVIHPATRHVHIRLRQSARGEIPVTLKAHREYGDTATPIDQDLLKAGTEESSVTETRRVKFPLPIPVADARSAAVVAIVPDNNIILAPESMASSGLAPQSSLPRRLSLPFRQQEPLTYRADSPSALFSATLSIHPRSVQTTLFSRVAFEEAKARVTQSIRYDVGYEPIERLELQIPNALAKKQEVEAYYNGERLPLVLPVRDDQSAEAENDAPTTAQVILPGARIGVFQLELRYTIALAPSKDDSDLSIRIPLIVPKDGELTESTAEVSPGDTQQITLRQAGDSSDSWELAPNSLLAPEANGIVKARGTNLLDNTSLELPLTVKTVQSSLPASVYVDRYWVQSHVSNTMRRDRVVFRLNTSRREVRVRLPQPMDLDRVEVLVNGTRQVGQSIRQDSKDRRILVVSIPPSGMGPHRLELNYQLAGGLDTEDFEPAQLMNQTVAKPIYWQIVLPSHIHVLSNSRSFVSENLWEWNGIGWSREPTFDLERLERWSGAQPGSPLPVASNVYLFSSTEPLSALRIQTTTRTTIVLTVSGATLLVGFGLVYAPVLRKPIVLWSLAAIAIVVAILFPEPALLFGQAAMLGAALAACAALLRSLLSRRTSHEILVGGTSSVVFPQEATASYSEPISNPPSASTETTITTPPSAIR